jgi:hypothetical protein
MQNQDSDLGIITDLLNTGEIPEEKVRPIRYFEPKLSLPLVQSSFAHVNLINAISPNA